MSIRVISCGDVDAVARAACRTVCDAAATAVAERGRFLLGLSGGRTPGVMVRQLRNAAIPWEATWVVQVDERVAPDGHADRNLTMLHQSLVVEGPLPETHLLAMPVTDPDLDRAARQYAAQLEGLAAVPFRLDLVQLGLGDDGHTASLIVGDLLDESATALVAVSGVYQGRQRLTLTLGAINAARQRLWVVTGESKRQAVTQLLAGDSSIPAGHICQEHAVLITDLA